MGTYGSRSGAGRQCLCHLLRHRQGIVKAKKLQSSSGCARAHRRLQGRSFCEHATNNTLTFPEVALQAYIDHNFHRASQPGVAVPQEARSSIHHLHLSRRACISASRDRSRDVSTTRTRGLDRGHDFGTLINL